MKCKHCHKAIAAFNGIYVHDNNGLHHCFTSGQMQETIAEPLLPKVAANG